MHGGLLLLMGARLLHAPARMIGVARRRKVHVATRNLRYPQAHFYRQITVQKVQRMGDKSTGGGAGFRNGAKNENKTWSHGELRAPGSRTTGRPASVIESVYPFTSSMGRRLSKKFYRRDATLVAPDLLGMHLVRRSGDGSLRVGRIVETEAYEGPHDLAAHSARGRRTPRTEVMFGEPGRSYVYLIYGIHHCFNVITAPRDVPHAVLVRALEPLAGIEGRAQGPGLLCRALSLDRSHNDLDLRGAELWIERPAPRDWVQPRIAQSPRIGIGSSGPWVEVPWRYFDADSSHVSKTRRAPSDRMR